MADKDKEVEKAKKEFVKQHKKLEACNTQFDKLDAKFKKAQDAGKEIDQALQGK